MALDWWEKPYPQGKPVPLPGFPRSLYPPDAKSAGKTPSEPGPDVKAVKRAVSRGGRWPWQTFDNNYSNAFSHGDTPNVADSGMEGFQRQQLFPSSPDQATGWFGKASFDALRTALIPDPLPNAGQHLIDATAANLFAEAWRLFQGHDTQPPPAPAKKTHRQQALELAVTQISTKESPPNSNNTKYGQWYGVNFQPWCAIFVTWCFLNSGSKHSFSFARGVRYAYVPYIVNDAAQGRYGLTLTNNPIPGDLVAYDWDGGVPDHVGIFHSGTPVNFQAIEGNTSVSNNSNGGEVMRRTRGVVNARRIWFVRVAEIQA